jgi:hypothetical protein
MTERSEIIEMMVALQLAGMRAAYDEIVTTGVKRQHSAERMIGALLKAEIAAKNARSINYQMGIAKLPLAKELADLTFDDTTINGALIEQLGTGAFLDSQRNIVLIGGTERARRTSRSASTATSSVPVARHASSMRSTSSTSWRPRSSSAARAASPTGLVVLICSCSTNWATCRSRSPAASCCST